MQHTTSGGEANNDISWEVIEWEAGLDIVEVKDETENITEGIVSKTSPVHFADETEQISEATNVITGVLKVVGFRTVGS